MSVRALYGLQEPTCKAFESVNKLVTATSMLLCTHFCQKTSYSYTHYNKEVTSCFLTLYMFPLNEPKAVAISTSTPSHLIYIKPISLNK